MKWITLFIFAAAYCFCAVPEGPKTLSMLEELNAGALLSYDAQTEIFSHQGIDFLVLKGSNRDISAFPVACIGSNPLHREIISLDPSHSPLLMEKYQELVLSLEQVDNPLFEVVRFVREEVFDEEISTEGNLNVFIEDWIASIQRKFSDFTETKERDLLPVIPIDTFVEVKMGVCRHHALVTAYFLDKLAKECKIPPGASYYVRDMVHSRTVYGGHAWNLYVFDDKSENWHVDTYWNVLKNLNVIADLNYLYKAYGRKAIIREKQRFLQ
jgi:hypothetical protein